LDIFKNVHFQKPLRLFKRKLPTIDIILKTT